MKVKHSLYIFVKLLRLYSLKSKKATDCTLQKTGMNCQFRTLRTLVPCSLSTLSSSVTHGGDGLAPDKRFSV